MTLRILSLIMIGGGVFLYEGRVFYSLCLCLVHGGRGFFSFSLLGSYQFSRYFAQ